MLMRPWQVARVVDTDSDVRESFVFICVSCEHRCIRVARVNKAEVLMTMMKISNGSKCSRRNRLFESDQSTVYTEW